jgi:hypothetical protein
MAIQTIAGFNPSFPELIVTNSGPFSSVSDLENNNNTNFRLVGNEYISVVNAKYRNLNSSTPTITGGNFKELFFNKSINNENLIPKTTTVFVVPVTGTFTISLSNRNQYIKLNSIPDNPEPELVILPELNLHERETFEITSANNVFTLSSSPSVTINYANPGNKYLSLCLRYKGNNTYDALGKPSNSFYHVYPNDPKVFDFNYDNFLSGDTDDNFFLPETNFFLSSSFETSLSGDTDVNFYYLSS